MTVDRGQSIGGTQRQTPRREENYSTLDRFFHYRPRFSFSITTQVKYIIKWSDDNIHLRKQKIFSGKSGL
jgi:hypothetical protein